MPSPEFSASPPSSITTVLRLLRERWWVIVLAAVVVAAAFLVKDSREVKLYESTATLLFGSAGSNVSGQLNTAASNVSSDPQRDQGTTLSLVGSSAVADRVKRLLSYPGPSSDLGALVSASARPDANLIDVIATDPDPARASQLANAFAEQYQLFRRDADRAGLRQGIDSLLAQYEETPASETATRVTLLSSITALRTSEATTTGGVQVVDRATPSSEPSSPRVRRDALLGLVLGLAIGLTLVFGADLVDRRLKGVPAFELAYGQAALAVVPLRRRPARDGLELQASLEPYRMLRLGLTGVSTTGDPHTVLVTSAVAGEGKSTTATGLARAIALSGQRVALVELDLRRPTLHRHFEVDRDAPGLASVLRGQATIEEVLTPGHVDTPTLFVVAAGGISARSAELLGAASMTRVLEELAKRFDAVILDAPPLLPVADTHAVLDLVSIDTCLLVAKPYLTTRDHVARARTIMGQHGRDRYGLVVNGLHGDQGTYVYEYDAMRS